LLRWQTGQVRRGRPPTRASVTKKIQDWLKARHMKELFQVDVGDQAGLPTLTYRFNHRGWTQLQRTLLGKTLLFTDNDDWTDAQIVRGYRAQHHVETGFRCMKDPHHICLRPQHHWTDQKIEVHVFCCVLALLLCSLLRRELHHQGIELSIPQLLEQLGHIREVGVIYPAPDKSSSPLLHTTLSQMSEEQSALYNALQLGRYRAA